MQNRNKKPLIFVINPGGTSTKIALFKGQTPVFSKDIEHSYNEIATFPDVYSQFDFRKKTIVTTLKSFNHTVKDIDVFIGRGGLLRPLPGGVYSVNRKMLSELKTSTHGEHASNLGAVLAHELARAASAPAYIANPVVVDEMMPEASITGHPDMPRRSIFHALSQKMVAEKASTRLGMDYRKSRLIVAHAGTGVSVGTHRNGKVIDVNNALEGDGPFSPERSGSLPLYEFYTYITQKKLTAPQVYKLITKQSGLVAHLETNDCRKIEKRIASGDRKANTVYNAFIIQTAKAIAAAAAVLSGNVHAIVLAGNVLKNRRFRNRLTSRIKFIAPVFVYTDNSEIQALAQAAYDAYIGARKVNEY